MNTADSRQSLQDVSISFNLKRARKTLIHIRMKRGAT